MTNEACSKPGCTGGHEPGKCIGHSSDGTGRACRKYPVKGMSVCRTHGAGSPQAKAAVARKDAADRLAAEVRRAATAGVLPLADPGTTLLESVAMMAQVVSFQRQKLAELDQPSLDSLDRFMVHVERLGRMAKLADDARLGERRLQREEQLDARYQLELDQVFGRLVELLSDLAVQRGMPAQAGWSWTDEPVRALARQALAVLPGVVDGEVA